MRYIIFLIIFFAFSTMYANQYEYNGSCKGYMDDFEECLDKELAKYNKELNYLYKNILKEIPNKDLKKIEHLWIKYKEADCNYMAREVHEGLYYQFIFNACLINKTKTRIAELKRSYAYAGWFEKRN